MRINEIMAYDSTGPDWIELYNRSEEDLDLSEAILWSDDPTAQLPWAFPEGTSIAAGGFLLVFCDEATAVEGELHASFRIGRRGGEIVLSRPSSTGMAVDRLAYPYMPEKQGFARFPDGGETLVSSPWTSPGRSNGTLVVPTATGTIYADGTVEAGIVATCETSVASGASTTGVAEFLDVPALAPGGWAAAAWAVDASSGSSLDAGMIVSAYAHADGIIEASDGVSTARPFERGSLAPFAALAPWHVQHGQLGLRFEYAPCAPLDGVIATKVVGVRLVLGPAP